MIFKREGVRCDIRERRWSPPPTPASCPLDYGEGLFVAKRGRGDYTCAGDTVLGLGRRRLEDGERITRGRFRCRRVDRTVKCKNRRTGHGFTISKLRARRF